MSNIKTLQLIEKLILATKEGRIRWDKLSNLFNESESINPILKNYILKKERSPYFYRKKRLGLYKNKEKYDTLNQFRSYYIEIKNGYTYILKYEGESEYYLIAVQGNNYSNIVELNNKNEYQAELMELVYLVEGQMDNYLDYVDEVINEL